jgi:hypothetical protein
MFSSPLAAAYRRKVPAGQHHRASHPASLAPRVNQTREKGNLQFWRLQPEIPNAAECELRSSVCNGPQLASGAAAQNAANGVDCQPRRVAPARALEGSAIDSKRLRSRRLRGRRAGVGLAAPVCTGRTPGSLRRHPTAPLCRRRHPYRRRRRCPPRRASRTSRQDGVWSSTQIG